MKQRIGEINAEKYGDDQARDGFGHAHLSSERVPKKSTDFFGICSGRLLWRDFCRSDDSRPVGKALEAPAGPRIGPDNSEKNDAEADKHKV